MRREKWILWLTVISFVAMLLIECSKLKEKFPTQPQEGEVQYHQSGWEDTQSANFHGKYIRNTSWNLNSCRKCHGNDYAGGTTNSSCNVEGCHPGTPEACTTCHGGVDNETSAPPKDIDNHIGKSYRGVGAHTAHVSNSNWAKAFDCDACHTKPATIDAPGHMDTNLPAEINWDELARTGNLSPKWDGLTCTDVYCHGSSLLNGKTTSPQWTQAATLACNACHGLPPESGAHEEHSEDYQFDCNLCHEGYYQNSSVNLSIHINGKKDVQLSSLVGGSYIDGVCSNVLCHGKNNTPQWTGEGEFTCVSCHGGLDNVTGAPPYDLSGNSDTNVKGVGAHTAHVMGGALSDGMDCDECHKKPTEISDPNHIDKNMLPAEIVWGELAKRENANPVWDGLQTCSDVYCHGEFKYGSSDNNPKWTVVDGTQATCGSCHGLPPPDPHVQITQCSLCHSSVVDDSNSIIDKTKHINGQNDL